MRWHSNVFYNHRITMNAVWNTFSSASLSRITNSKGTRLFTLSLNVHWNYKRSNKFFSLYIYFYDVEEKNECINCNVRLEMDSRVKRFKIVSLHTKWIRLHFKLENLCQELKRPNSTKRLHWFSIQFRIEVKMKAKKNSEFISYRFEWWFIEIRCTDVSAP